MQTVSIAGRLVGSGQSTFVIAEAGVNHNGEPKLAKRLVDEAVGTGADAVKFQTFKTERLVSPDSPKADYQLQTVGPLESQFEMLRRLELSSETYRELMDYCRQKGILFMSTPFDEESADFLAELSVEVFKIPSGEITNLPLLAHVAQKNRPMIISTGMANLDEVETAVRTIERAGNRNLVLLQCVSSYPADPGDANLRAMDTMAAAFNVPVGYSDHTSGIEVALAAVALGASVIEKHLTLNRNLRGPDHRASLEPDEFAAMVRGIRIVEAALGSGRKEPAASEANTAAVARKSLVAARDIPAGATLTDAMIVVQRPGTGLPPAMRCHLVGRTVRIAVPAGALITWEMLA